MSRLRIYCNNCKNDTWHELSSEVKQDFYNQLWGYTQLVEAQIYRCLGCDQITFRRLIHPMPFEEEQGKVVEEFFPERSFRKREKGFFVYIPENIKRLYDETIAAHDSKLLLLTTAGLRALIEAIVIDKFPESEYDTSLYSKVNVLRKHFSNEVVDVLHEFREMGNKALHKQIQPEELDLHRAIYVIEDLMTFFYKIEQSASFYKDLKEEKKPNNDGQT